MNTSSSTLLSSKHHIQNERTDKSNSTFNANRKLKSNSFINSSVNSSSDLSTQKRSRLINDSSSSSSNNSLPIHAFSSVTVASSPSASEADSASNSQNSISSSSYENSTSDSSTSSDGSSSYTSSHSSISSESPISSLSSSSSQSNLQTQSNQTQNLNQIQNQIQTQNQNKTQIQKLNGNVIRDLNDSHASISDTDSELITNSAYNELQPSHYDALVSALNTESLLVRRVNHDSCMQKMRKIKSLHRTSLTAKDWSRYNYKAKFSQFVKFIQTQMPSSSAPSIEQHKYTTDFKPHKQSSSKKENQKENQSNSQVEFNYHLPTHQTNYSTQISQTNQLSPNDELSHTIDRHHCSNLSVDEFIRRYESVPATPCIIQGLTDSWSCRHLSPTSLTHTAMYASRMLVKCGEDDNGKSLRIPIDEFLHYMKYNSDNDDSPLYVFESCFDDHLVGRRLLNDYKVPAYFSDDLFHLVSEAKRPPYRWFLIGPKRSGSDIHQDPLSTSAWNTLLFGQKLWILFPPDVPKHLLKGTNVKLPQHDSQSITYFMSILPRIKQYERDNKISLGIREFIQLPGETVFVPSHWWHAVLNLTDTIAITQNFCSKQNFDEVWRSTRVSRKHMAKRWLNQLKIKYPDLAKRGEEMNKQDNFEFVFSTKADKEQRQFEKKAKKQAKKRKHQEIKTQKNEK